MDSFDNLKVSVIIPSFNRFNFLLNTINSVKAQTFKNLEIIVVNDGSNDENYYSYNWNSNNIKILHNKENSKNLFGYPSIGFIRNRGIEVASGNYIAFCDDDDIWFENKIKMQLDAMKLSGCKMSSSDGLIGYGIFDNSRKYLAYNAEFYYQKIKEIYKIKNSNLMDKGFPEIWDREFIKVHNCIICSSVIVEKNILNNVDNFSLKKPPGEDYDCWLKVLNYTNSAYINDICFYYDLNHGLGRNY